jgi:hypothetical protein
MPLADLDLLTSMLGIFAKQKYWDAIDAKNVKDRPALEVFMAVLQDKGCRLAAAPVMRRF